MPTNRLKRSDNVPRNVVRSDLWESFIAGILPISELKNVNHSEKCFITTPNVSFLFMVSQWLNLQKTTFNLLQQIYLSNFPVIAFVNIINIISFIIYFSNKYIWSFRDNFYLNYYYFFYLIVISFFIVVTLLFKSFNSRFSLLIFIILYYTCF